MERTPAESSRVKTDKLFAVPRSQASDFDFGKDTVAVFDDMLDRSVPFYREIQRMVSELVADTARRRHGGLRSRLLDGQYDSWRSAPN